MVEAHAIASVYSGKVYVIWNQEDFIDKYELYRNDVLVAVMDKENPKTFGQPTLFDHDHHTNLFRKESAHQLMYTDDNVKPYTEYRYYIKAYRGEIDSWSSDTIYITLQ